MIIKSMSRKTASFSQLVNYLNKGRIANDFYAFRHNIYSHKPYYIVKEYQENYRNLKRQKNSNALYHEIISLKYQNNLTVEEQREMLKDLLERYVQVRANNNMVYGVIHEQRNQIHCHLVISSNEVASERNKRLSRKEFAEVKSGLWDYASVKYPKLEIERNASRKARAKTKVVDNEVQFKKRTGKKSGRELVKERLETIFLRSKNPQEFVRILREEKIQIYQRGKVFGFLDEVTGRKYRLRTLELEREFAKMDSSFVRMAKEAQNRSYQGQSQGRQEEFAKEDFVEVESESKERFRKQIKAARSKQNATKQRFWERSK
jgi:hypothetical protein